MMKIALAILLIAHGLVHAILAVARSSAPGGETRHFFHRGGTQLAPASFRDERFSRAVDWNEFSGFVYPGFYPHRPWYFWRDRVDLVWRAAAVISACVSLLLLILFWHPWLPVGILINLGIIVVLLANWPPVDMFGS